MQIVYTSILYHKLKCFATGYFGIIAKNEESVQIVGKLLLKGKMIFASFWYKRKWGLGQHDAAKPSPKRGTDAAQPRDGGQSPKT